MHKNSSSASSDVRATRTDVPVAITWHLPEVDNLEATVELLDTVSPHGRPVRSWHIVTDAGIDTETPTWSSAPVTSSRALNRRARIRVARHDGPCLVQVRLFDSAGGRFSQTYRFDR